MLCSFDLRLRFDLIILGESQCCFLDNQMQLYPCLKKQIRFSRFDDPHRLDEYLLGLGMNTCVGHNYIDLDEYLCPPKKLESILVVQ